MKTKVYITITPDQAAQDHIRETISFLKNQNPNTCKFPIKWVDTQKFHIQLAYLGAITDEALLAAYQAIATTTVRFQSLSLGIGGLSYFFSDRKESGSTITLDITDSEKKLRELFKDLYKELMLAGFSPQKHFVPHIVIGILPRQKEKHDQMRILDQLTEVEIPKTGIFTINSIEVLGSPNDDVLNPRRTLLQSIPLGI